MLAPAVAALGDGKGHLQAIAPGEIFFTYLKGALLAGFVAALPVVLWQAWQFIAPGLYKRERRIGEFFRRPTLPFNGYGDQVARLYAGMDLRREF